MDDVSEESFVGALDGVAEHDRTRCLPTLLGFLGKLTSVLKIMVFDLTHPAVALFLIALLRMNPKLTILIATNAVTTANKDSLVGMLGSHKRVQVVIHHTTMHCKDIIVDEKFLVTGSANATRGGLERNTEAMMAFKVGTPLTSAVARVSAVQQAFVLRTNPPAAPLARTRTKTLTLKKVNDFIELLEHMKTQDNEREEREEIARQAVQPTRVQQLLSECEQMTRVFTAISAHRFASETEFETTHREVLRGIGRGVLAAQELQARRNVQ